MKEREHEHGNLLIAIVARVAAGGVLRGRTPLIVFVVLLARPAMAS